LNLDFQNIKPTSIEYLQRLRDECVLLKQCDNVIAFFKKHKQTDKVAQVALIKLDHVYYKTDSIYENTKNALKNKPKDL